MKIKELLESHPDQLKSTLMDNCGPYLGEIGYAGALRLTPVYRGSDDIEWGQSYDAFRVVPVRQDRKPLTTSRYIHPLIDKWFVEKCGIPFRSCSMFVSGSDRMANEYSSSVSIAVPIGDYDYAWSPRYGDLYAAIYFNSNDPLLPDLVKNLMEKGNYKINQDLRGAIASGHEIMIACKSAVLVNPTWAS